MTVQTRSIGLQTRGDADVHDITGQVAAVVADTDFADGIVTIFCPSATSAVTTLEYESGCVSDLRRAIADGALFWRPAHPGRLAADRLP